VHGTSAHGACGTCPPGWVCAQDEGQFSCRALCNTHCGDIDEPCCSGQCAGLSECQDNVCVACGGIGAACCSGGVCGPHATCVDGTCVDNSA
jgi:hypothetical protein